MEPVTVRVRDCECPNHPHNGVGDVVYMRAKPNVALGLGVEADIIRAAGSGDLLRRMWAITYIREGVVGWNFLDEKGKDRPLDVQELLDDIDMGMVIAEKADELYGDRVVSPLLEKLFPTPPPATPSPPGPTEPSTSPNPASTPSRSRRSSRGTSAGSRRSKR